MLATLALTTVDEVLSQAGMRDADPNRVASLINQASQDFINKLGRELHFQEGRVDRVPGFGTRDLHVSLNPMTELTAVSLDGGAIDITELYFTSDPLGETSLRWSNNACWRWTAAYAPGIDLNPIAGTEAASYLVEYSGGYVTPQQANDDPLLTRSLPFDIERAVLDYVVSLHRGSGRDRAVTNRTSASGSQSWQQYPAGYIETINHWKHFG